MKRIFWLDVVRTIAILLVVLTHSYEAMVAPDIATLTIFSYITRLGVPLFFMISGAMILPKAHTLGLSEFYKKRVPQFLILLIVYSILTTIMKEYVYGDLTMQNLWGIIGNSNGIYPANTGAAIQMWYMYSIIGLYLIAPFVSTMLVNLSTKRIFAFLVLCIIINFIPELIKPTQGVLWRFGREFTGAYLTYFIMGYYIVNRGGFRLYRGLKNYSICIAAILLPIVAGVVFNVVKGSFNNQMSWYSTSLPILVSSTALFVLLKAIFENREGSSAFTLISQKSFGIFLTHFIVMFFVNKYIVTAYCPDFGFFVKTFISFIFTFTASLLVTYIMGFSKVSRFFIN